MGDCRRCPDGHPAPATRRWAAAPGSGQAKMGGSAYLVVEPFDARHVNEDDADWLGGILAALRSVVPDGHRPEAAFAGWVIGVYEPAVKVIAAAFAEAVAASSPETADHFARSCLARLMSHDPAISVEALR